MNVKNLYLTKNEPIWFEVAQGAAGVQFGIRVQDYTIPAGAVVNIYVSKPDGTMVYNAAEVSGNTITVTTTTQMTAVVGVSNCQVQILSTGILLRTFVFHLKVRESIIDETAIESTDEFGALETALQTISQYDADIEELQDAVSDMVTKTSLKNKGSINDPVFFDAYGLPQLVPNLITGSWTNRTKIPSGADLNSYTAPGVYGVESDAIAGDITNIPRAASGTLICISKTSATYMTQIYLPTSLTSIVYMRTRSGSSWSDWSITANILVGTVTGTTSAAGNLQLSPAFTQRSLIMAAYTSSSDMCVTPYPSSGATTGGATGWWFHVQDATSATGDAVANQSVTITYFYIPLV